MKKLVLTAPLLCLFAALPSVSAQGLMDERIPEFRARQGQEFEMLCMLKNLSCGFEEAEDDGKEPEALPVLALSSATVHDVLDAIMARYPRHEWHMDDGVLFMVPKEKFGQAPHGAAYSASVLKPFSFKDRPLSSALTRLCAMADNNCAAATAAGFAKEEPAISVSVSKGDTLAHILNGVAASQGNAMWSVLVSGKDSYQITLKRWEPDLGPQLLSLLLKAGPASTPVAVSSSPAVSPSEKP